MDGRRQRRFRGRGQPRSPTVKRVTWHLAEPAASYLVTVAFGTWDTVPRVTSARAGCRSRSTCRPRKAAPSSTGWPRTRVTAMDWFGGRPRPLPVPDSLGFLFPRRLDERHGDPDHDHPRRSTSTPCRCPGAGARDRAPLVGLRDLAALMVRRVDERGHDDVPCSGLLWEVRERRPRRRRPDVARVGGRLRDAADHPGPPADYEPNAYLAERNVYYLPAVMWPTTSAAGSATRRSGGWRPRGRVPIASPARTATPSPPGGARRPVRT